MPPYSFHPFNQGNPNMPSLNHLNPPPHPFWDFVAGIEDHPIFAAYGSQPEQPRQAEQQPQAAAEPSEKAKGKQPSVEDPPEVDPATVKPTEGERGVPFRGRGRFGNAFDEGKDGKEGCRRGGPGCRGGRGGHRAGPPPFMFGGPRGFWGGPPREGWNPHDAHAGPPHTGPGHCGPRGHHHGPPGAHGSSPPRHGRRGPGQRGGFDLGQFLNNLGERLGVDLAGAAENLGVDKFSAPRNNSEVDFEPRADIFDSAENYIIHLSLPGAKKDDVGVDWDGENSVLRVAGVVHRPGVDETMLAQLAVNGRKRENGVFEKAIRLGTKRDPASIDVNGISAKMTDGVLVIRVPKVEVEHKKREVPVSGSGSPSPARNSEKEKEKDLLFDADEEMHDAQAPTTVASTESTKAKDAEKEAEAARDDRSETVAPEQLPRYEAEEAAAAHDDSDWEKYGSEEEGEYVKINVD